MKSVKLLFAAFLAIAPLAVFAQTPPLTTTTQPSTVPVRAFVPGPNSTLVSAPPVTQNTVSTTGPVQSTTTISVGTLAGQVLTWAVTAFGSLLATIFAAWGVRLFKIAGVQITDAARTRLQEIILNGLNEGAKTEAANLDGKDQVTIKDAVVARAVTYAQVHGADSIKQLGLDPTSGIAVEAIKARIETAINDPSVATPTVLDAPGVAPKAA